MAFYVAYYIMEVVNNNILGYLGLIVGVVYFIIVFGNEWLNEIFVGKMLGGQWGGIMCFMELQVGSLFLDIIIIVYFQEDGIYWIKGQKIFIFGGDYEYNDNFVYFVLACIEGVLVGIKGIFLFVVLKKCLEVGNLVFNDVIMVGDY